MKSIYVKGQCLGYVLTKADGILEHNQDELEEIVGYLESNGVRREWIGFVVSRCPHVLSFSMDEMRTRVDFYLDMGMNKNDFGTMVFQYPKALGSFSLEEMNIKVTAVCVYYLCMIFGVLLLLVPLLIKTTRWEN